MIDADIRNLKYFRATRGMIAGTPVDVSRTGYTGDLGYELWIAWNHAVKVWDAIMNAGRNFNLLPAGILALDVARIEAGLILTDVDYISSKKALVEAQKFSPYEIGLGRLVHLEKESFAGRSALMEEQRTGTKRKLVGLEVDWTEVEAQYEKVGLAPHVQSTASRVHVPVYAGRSQVGKATSTTWSPVLKKMVALASIDSAWASTGVTLQIEITVEAVRQRARAKVVPIPFFSPPRKTATPVA